MANSKRRNRNNISLLFEELGHLINRSTDKVITNVATLG